MIRRLLCWATGHQFRVVQAFRYSVRRLKCKRCNGDWVMNDETKHLLPWDGSFEEMYYKMGHSIKEPQYGHPDKEAYI